VTRPDRNPSGVAAGDRKGALIVDWRPPGPEHRDQIAEIVAETGVFRSDEIDVALEVFDGFCDAPRVDYWALGAFSGPDQLAGFVFFGPTPCTVDTWDLYWIAVRPDSQGTGTGRGLMKHVEQLMREAGARMCAIETSSRDDYTSTRAFYLACGYDEVARVPDFYDRGDDRVTYAKVFGSRRSFSRSE
jgi:GNAT superfamily N-acetyltransferase